MKKTRRALALLLVFTIVFSMPMFTFALDEVETKYAYLVGTKNGNTTGLLAYDCYGADGSLTLAQGGTGGVYGSACYVLYGSKNSHALLKIDLSAINSVDYTTKDIQKVELLISTGASGYADKTARTFKIADVTSDWNVGDISYPAYDTSYAETVSHTFVAVAEDQTQAAKAYPSLVNDAPYSNYSDLQKFDHSADITNFVKRNLEKGESETKLFLYDGNNYYINYFALFITYKDNNKPSIVVNKVEGEASVAFSGTISDSDGNEITSATYSVDGKEATAITLAEGAYNFELDTSDLSPGKHTITFVAIDSLGAVTTRNVDFVANKPLVNYAPEILVKLPAPFLTGASVTIPFEVYDFNQDEFTVTAKLDDTDLTVNNIDDKNYTISVSSDAMTEGNHTLSITATDFWNDTDSTSTYERTINVSGVASNRAIIEKSDAVTYVYGSTDAFTASKPTSGNYIIYKNSYDYLAKYDLSAYKDKQIDKIELIFARTKEYLVRQMDIYEINSEWTSSDLDGKGIENFPSYDENVAAVGVFATTNGVSDAGYTDITGGYDCIMDITDYAFEKLNNDETMLNLLLRCAGGIWMGSTQPKLVVTYKDTTATTHQNIRITKYKNGMTKGENANFAANTSNVAWTVAGNVSSSTVIDENGKLTIGSDEEVGYITVIATKNNVSDSVCVRILEKNENEFGTPVMQFGVLSDIHMRTTSTMANETKFKTAMKALQTLAGGKEELDALLIPGDVTDAIASKNNRNGYSDVAQEAYLEVSSFKNAVKEVLDDNTMVLYSLGNHDTNGAGQMTISQENLPTTNIAEYFVKILSGWDGTSDTYDSFAIDTNSADYKRFFGSDDAIGTVVPEAAEEIGLYNGNRHVKFNGYHFLAVEPTEYAAYYSTDTCTWVRGELEKAVLDAPDKPIFVITHPVIYDTTSESKATDSNVSQNLTPILKDFPQVVLWTGHVHSPLNVDNAVMQNGFTALSASSTYYLSAIVGYNEDIDPSTKNLPMGSFVEIDANKNVKISRYILADENNPVLIDEPIYIMGTKKDGSHLYSYDKSRKLYNNVPAFSQNAKVDVEKLDDGSVTVSFPAASDDGTVTYYNVEITDCNKNSVSEKISSAYYTVYNIPNEYSRIIDCSGLDTTGEIIVTVSAVDEWDAESKVISNLDVSVVNVTYSNNGNGVYNVSGTLINSGDNLVTGEAIYVLYDEQDRFLQINHAPVPADTYRNMQDLISPDIIYNGESKVAYAKIFVWDSLKGLIPLTRASSSK